MPALAWRADPLLYAGDPLTWGEDVSIPGVETLHPRAVWEEVGFRMALDFTTTPSPYKAANVDTAVAHYSAAASTPDGDPGETTGQIIPWLRAIQRDYYINRTGGNYTRRSDGRLFPGYPIGYSFAVDWLGGVWELRGFEFLPAANAGHNTHTIPVLFITDGASPASDLALASARAIWREARRLSGRTVTFKARPLGHGELLTTTGTGTPTACPGAGILGQLHNGLGDLDYDDTPPEDDDMQPLPVPDRVYDSRTGHGPFAAGEVRTIAVGMCTKAHIHITAISTAAGFVSVSGTDDRSPASLVNFDADGVDSGGAPIGVPDGHVRVFCSAPADICVDVYARG